ncbi:MAG: phage terminase large subunit family protein [Vicinamibacteria bacterium]|nr:phage terminase large subunit family protein [Vicinamibacteria bacterium]
MLNNLVDRTWRRFAPPPRVSVAGWADEHRHLGRGESPVPGPWRTDRTPYLREPMNALTESSVDTVVLFFSSQIGKTEVLINGVLFAYSNDPGPGMVILPTLELSGSFSQDRLSPALKACSLQATTSKTRTTGDAVLHKRLNSSPLTLCGANSPASLASRPVRWLWCDEIDHWPAATPEGDPLALAIQRTAAFRRRKVVLASTPTIKHASRIEDWFERSDRRSLWAPCPRCSVAFVVEWNHVRWETGDPSTAYIECPHCRGRIEDAERAAMFSAATWRPEAPEVTRIRGYRAWAVCSPWVRLSEMVAAFLQAKRQPDTLQTWVNLTRGESWEAPTDGVESASLLLRREHYAEEVPAAVDVLTCGVDTQDDRLEALVVGWTAGEISWVISRESFPGDPEDAETWRTLDEMLLRSWPREGGGHARIASTLVDCLGHRTGAVYRAVIPRQNRGVRASVGRDGGLNGMLVSPPKALRTPHGTVQRHLVDASQVKGLIYARLRIEDPDLPGYIHFPDTVGDAFFSELTAEHQVVQRNKYGVPVRKWAMRPGRERNESLDTFGLALAALRILAPTPARFAEVAARVAAAERTP